MMGAADEMMGAADEMMGVKRGMWSYTGPPLWPDQTLLGKRDDRSDDEAPEMWFPDSPRLKPDPDDPVKKYYNKMRGMRWMAWDDVLYRLPINLGETMKFPTNITSDADKVDYVKELRKILINTFGQYIYYGVLEKGVSSVKDPGRDKILVDMAKRHSEYVDKLFNLKNSKEIVEFLQSVEQDHLYLTTCVKKIDEMINRIMIFEPIDHRTQFNIIYNEYKDNLTDMLANQSYGDLMKNYLDELDLIVAPWTDVKLRKIFPRVNRDRRDKYSQYLNF